MTGLFVEDLLGSYPDAMWKHGTHVAYKKERKGLAMLKGQYYSGSNVWTHRFPFPSRAIILDRVPLPCLTLIDA